MGKINWRVRLKNRKFVLSLVSFILLNAQVVLTALGYKIELDTIETIVVSSVNVVFGVLALAGLVQDPTTTGYSDSERALTYTEPK